MEFIHIPNISVQGKVIQEVISKVLVYGFAGEYTNIGKTGVDRLYADFCGETKTIKTEYDLELLKPTIEEVMKTANYIIENSTSKDFWKKRDIMILLIVLWDLVSSKKKFDSKLLKTGYIKTIQKLKAKNARLNKWAFEVGYLYDINAKHPNNKLPDSIRERDHTFASSNGSGDSPITLEFVIESIKDSLVESGIIKTRDTRRTFTREQKQQVLAVQDNQCACCHEDLNPDNTSSYEGDHIILYSDGGKTTIDNCEVLCVQCHHIKTQQPETYKKIRKLFVKSAK
jgi:5-methylcytosine-specific restriction protein A